MILASLRSGHLLLTAAPLLLLAQQPAPPPDLDRLIQSRLEEAGIMGLAAAVIVDGQVIWSQGFGFRDARRTKPFTPDTPVNVASITKTVTGVAMMQLVSQGRLSLDEDINRYLPFPVRNPRFPGQPITLRMLATHTSSIRDRWEVYRDSYRFSDDPVEPLSSFLTAYFSPRGRFYSPSNFADAAPGTERDYSNLGAGLVGFIIERMTGERLDQYTKRNIFAPLAMSSTGWLLRDFSPGQLSTLFAAQGGHTIPIPHYHAPTYPDGGMRTSVNDLSRFFRALLGRGAIPGARILPEREADEMLRFQFTAAPYPKGYGPGEGNSGLFWRTKFSGSRIGHGGNDPGVQAEMLASLDRRVAVVLLSNTSFSGPEGRPFAAIFQDLWTFAESRRR